MENNNNNDRSLLARKLSEKIGLGNAYLSVIDYLTDEEFADFIEDKLNDDIL